ncbi:hypothetical protein B0H13DRAFT_2514265 [Mycena leptocephala]|nr:hypothetical protein B0H13DRAFT_2514265 [Mycena leptocephala]
MQHLDATRRQAVGRVIERFLCMVICSEREVLSVFSRRTLTGFHRSHCPEHCCEVSSICRKLPVFVAIIPVSRISGTIARVASPRRCFVVHAPPMNCAYTHISASPGLSSPPDVAHTVSLRTCESYSLQIRDWRCMMQKAQTRTPSVLWWTRCAIAAALRASGRRLYWGGADLYSEPCRM